MTATEEWLRHELEAAEAKVERVWAFVRDRDDDISIGVRRCMQPPRVCEVCGHVDDWAVNSMCPCWKPVGERDLDQLRGMGIDIRDQQASSDSETGDN